MATTVRTQKNTIVKPRTCNPDTTGNVNNAVPQTSDVTTTPT